MLRAIVMKGIGDVRSRSISFAAKNFDKVSKTTSTGSGKLKSSLTKFDLIVLVWTKNYKSIADIPERVAFETILKSRSRFRIKACNYMIVATILGCITMIISGKRAAARGESVQKMNLDWHKKYNEEAAASEKAQAK